MIFPRRAAAIIGTGQTGLVVRRTRGVASREAQIVDAMIPSYTIWALGSSDNCFLCRVRTQFAFSTQPGPSRLGGPKAWSDRLCIRSLLPSDAVLEGHLHAEDKSVVSVVMFEAPVSHPQVRLARRRDLAGESFVHWRTSCSKTASLCSFLY